MTPPHSSAHSADIIVMYKNRRAQTKYRQEFADQAYKYALLGARTPDLALLFQVTPETIDAWRERHEEFNIAVRDGGELADAQVAAKLFQRATGFSRVNRKVQTGPKGRTVTTATDYYPPDTAAAQFWLKNRQPSRWQDKHEVVATRESIDFSHLDYGQRAALRASLLEAVQKIPQDSSSAQLPPPSPTYDPGDSLQ